VSAELTEDIAADRMATSGSFQQVRHFGHHEMGKMKSFAVMPEPGGFRAAESGRDGPVKTPRASRHQQKDKKRGKITTALSASALRPSATLLQAAPLDDQLFAPCEESTPPSADDSIQMLKARQGELRQGNAGGGVTFSQWSLPAARLGRTPRPPAIHERGM